ncbi:MAG: DUF2807 domain-containing protein [Bacteroidetes bacterium]|nr:DUF2807 domain-containing protein [Bacteroidota bacterium]
MQKTVFTFLITILAGSFIPGSGQVQAQDNIVKEVREVADFSGIDVGGAFDILLSQADVTKVVIETEKENIDKIQTRVNNGILEISSKNIKNSDKLNVYIISPEINNISIHGAADLKGLSGLHGTELVIRASGASDAKLDVVYDKINSNVSGAASLVLRGEARRHTIVVSGAGDVDAGKLLTEISSATVSGAGSASVNASTEVVSNTSGAGTIDLVSKPETLTIVSGEIIGESETLRVQSTEYGDTTKVRIAGIRVEVIDNDSTRITIGNRMLTVNENGNVKWCKVRLRKFNGHWAGVELGVNGYLTKDYDMKFSPEDEYMDLRMEKSIQVNLNIYEQNIALSRNQEWGMLSGIGLSWNNYRFRRPTTLNPDSSYLVGYIDEGISVRKSKLAIAYLQIPLIFEWQNHTLRQRNSFHVGLGVVLGVRLWSWQKKYYDELNKQYTLTQYDPATGQYIDKWQRTSPNYNKTHTYDDYHLQPFKADATFRIGWGYVNLFATYNLVPMFRKDKGPELHQFAAGITLLGW